MSISLLSKASKFLEIYPSQVVLEAIDYLNANPLTEIKNSLSKNTYKQISIFVNRSLEACKKGQNLPLEDIALELLELGYTSLNACDSLIDMEDSIYSFYEMIQKLKSYQNEKIENIKVYLEMVYQFELTKTIPETIKVVFCIIKPIFVLINFVQNKLYNIKYISATLFLYRLYQIYIRDPFFAVWVDPPPSTYTHYYLYFNLFCYE